MRSRNDLSRLAATLGGLPVLGCLAGSAAAQAGVRYGDVLLAVDGVPTPTWDEFLAVRARCRGRLVARIFRDGQVLDVLVEWGTAAAPSPGAVLDELIAQRVLGSDDEPHLASEPLDDN